MKICLWRYLENQRNYPGYNLSADGEGCEYLKKRLHDPWSRSSIPLDEPDTDVLSVPNNQGGRAPVQAFEKLRIEVFEERREELFSIKEGGGVLKLLLPASQVPQLIKGVEDVERGEGDYAIHGEGVSLWFWWQVSNGER